mgnify:FL=1
MEAHPSITHWDEFQLRLRDRVNPNAWQTWLEPLEPELNDGVLRLAAPTDFHRRWVRDRFFPDIEESCVAVYGDSVTVILDALENTNLADAEPIDAVPADLGAATTVPNVAPTTAPAPAPAPQAPPVQDFESRLIAKYTFENFVVGQSNRFAHAAAMAVAEQPGSHYNPCLLYTSPSPRD